MQAKRASAIVAVILLTECAADKMWTQRTRIDDPKLWKDAKLPCAGQRVILPEAEVFALPAADFSLGAELVLPLNGLLLLPQSMSSLPLAQGGCSGDAQLTSPDAGSWHDPANWRETESFASALPHLMQIPCRYDGVTFPDDDAFKVRLQHTDVAVSRLAIGQRSLSNADFGALQNTLSGRAAFKMNRTLRLMSDHCIDPRGCECGNADLRSVVCAMPGASCTKAKPACSDALRPDLHCCYNVCGGVVHIETEGKSVKLSRLENDIRTNLAGSGALGRPKEDADWADVRFHLSRTAPDAYQVVFVDSKGNIANAVKASRAVYEYWYKVLSDEGLYVWLEESGTSPPSALAETGRAFGAIFAIVIIIVLMYLLKTAYTKRSINTPLPFSLSAPSLSSISSRFTDSSSFVFSLPRLPTLGQFRFSRFQDDVAEMEMNLPDNAEAEETTEAERHAPRLEILDPRAIRFKTLKEEEDEGEEAGPSAVKSFENPLYEEALAPEQVEHVQVQVEQAEAVGLAPAQESAEAVLIEPLVDVKVDVPEEDNEAEDEWPDTPLCRMEQTQTPPQPQLAENETAPIVAEALPSAQNTETVPEGAEPQHESNDGVIADNAKLGPSRDSEEESERSPSGKGPEPLQSETDNLIDDEEDEDSVEKQSQ